MRKVRCCRLKSQVLEILLARGVFIIKKHIMPNCFSHEKSEKGSSSIPIEEIELIPCNEPHRHTEIDFRDGY